MTWAKWIFAYLLTAFTGTLLGRNAPAPGSTTSAVSIAGKSLHIRLS